MSLNKREFLKLGGAIAGTTLLAGSCAGSVPKSPASPSGLHSITKGVVPVSVADRKTRIAKAQELMTEAGLDAVVIEPGSTMVYFSGIRWWRSERLTALVIPRTGDIAVVTPYFEEPSVRESMTFGEDVRTWHEHENPFTLIAGILADRGMQAAKVGCEKTVRYFVVEGLQSLSKFEVAGAQQVVDGCRMYKSAHEIALMQKASEVTLLAYAHVHKNLQSGMSAEDIKSLMAQAQRDLGGQSPWGLALLGPASAYPHGSKQVTEVQEGQIVLMDCGCAVEGYQSDISRTFVYGTPSTEQRKMWTAVRKGQEVAFESAQLGRTAGSVDDAVRAYYESLGYGPDYKTPGLSHRTGHGIGMDGHESTNIVRGNATPLAPGMCFSNEPGLYDFAKFGVRLEDCIYMTETGPRWFTVPPKSIEQPLGTLG